MIYIYSLLHPSAPTTTHLFSLHCERKKNSISHVFYIGLPTAVLLVGLLQQCRLLSTEKIIDRRQQKTYVSYCSLSFQIGSWPESGSSLRSFTHDTGALLISSNCMLYTQGHTLFHVPFAAMPDVGGMIRGSVSPSRPSRRSSPVFSYLGRRGPDRLELTVHRADGCQQPHTATGTSPPPLQSLYIIDQKNNRKGIVSQIRFIVFFSVCMKIKKKIKMKLNTITVELTCQLRC